MIPAALLLAALLLPSLPALARTLPYWQIEGDMPHDQVILKARLLKANGNDAGLAASQLLAAGWVLVARGAPETAIKRFNEAALFTPRDPAISQGLMIAQGARGDSSDAMQAAYRFALKQTPLYRRHLVHRSFGDVMLARNETSLALPAFRKSLRGGDVTPELLLCIARLFFGEGKRATARLYYNWAERITP